MTQNFIYTLCKFRLNRAIESRSKLLHNYPNFSGYVDTFLSYEMLENLLNSIKCLHQISVQIQFQCLIITAPYSTNSRVFLYSIRNVKKSLILLPRESIFLASLLDWGLIFRFSDYQIVYSQQYTQYSKKLTGNLLKYLCREVKLVLSFYKEMIVYCQSIRIGCDDFFQYKRFYL
jgi:hypothetical protein